MAVKKEWLLYALRCRDNSLYCGITNDLQRRLHAHNSGKGSKYTRSRLPVYVAYFQACPSKSAALKAEYAFKQLYKSQKEAVVHAHATARKHRK